MSPKPATEVRPRMTEAMEFLRMQLQDENGFIPPDGYIRAAEHISRMRAETREPLGAGVSRTSWTWIGPGNIGGRVIAILIHPTDPSKMWVASAGGGIWKSTDGGTTWSPVDDFQISFIVEPGLTYYIEIGDGTEPGEFGEEGGGIGGDGAPPSGGLLQLNVVLTAPRARPVRR